MGSDRVEDTARICQLFASDEAANATLALQLLKGDKELEQKVIDHYRPVLFASNRRTLRALPAILQQLKAGKGTMNARMQLGSVPEIHGFIKKIALNGEFLEELPEWIRALPNLKELALSDCSLEELPEWIGELTKLTFLSIADNQVRVIPASIGNLTQLKVCYFSENNLETLPDSIRNLQQLEFFYVSKNNISKGELERIRQLLPHTRVY